MTARTVRTAPVDQLYIALMNTIRAHQGPPPWHSSSVAEILLTLSFAAAAVGHGHSAMPSKLLARHDDNSPSAALN
jgi:hypothetical protein